MNRKPTSPSDAHGPEPAADPVHLDLSGPAPPDDEAEDEGDDQGDTLLLELDLTAEEASPGEVLRGTAVIRARLRDAPKGPK